MLKVFETNLPIVQVIKPKSSAYGIVVNQITIDLVRRMSTDSVYMYFCDGTNMIPFFRLTSVDTPRFICQQCKFESWKDAWIEVHVVGSGSTFVSIDYSYNPQPKSIKDCIDTSQESRLYYKKQKIKTVVIDKKS
jgi:hypothetical protein